MRMTTMVVAAAVLVLAGAAGAQTHAPWPADWNNWNDPALWCTVGDPGNAADTRVMTTDGTTGYGAVPYAFKIGTFEVTAGQYTAFLNAVAATDTYGLYNQNMAYHSSISWGCNIQQRGSPGNYTYTVASDFANRPVNFVSWGDAARFANWLTNGTPTGPQGPATTEDGSYALNGAVSNGALLGVTRKPVAQGGRFYIPTEDEWYKAAYFKGGSNDAGYWDYPTGTNAAPGRDLADASGNNANFSGEPYPIYSGGYTTEAGEFQNSHSPCGTFDQGGNVWEWNEAVIGSFRGMRGACFDNYGDKTGAAVRYKLVPSGENDYFGFRVVEVPEPATLSLLAAGGLAVWRQRKK